MVVSKRIQLPASDIYTFVIEGTDIKLTYSRSNDAVSLQILRDDTVQTVKKKLLMELNRVYSTDVAYEEIFMNAHVVSMPDPAQLFRDSLPNTHTTLSREEILALCSKYGSHYKNKDKYTLSDFVSFFEPTRKLVAIGAKYAEHKYPFFIPDPREPNTLTDNNIELDFSETQLFFQYGDLADNVIYVNIAQSALSNSHPGQHERILRTFYRSLQYTHGIVNFAQLNEKHNELVENTNAALTEKAERAFNSVQMFHDIYNSRTEELPWTRGISAISFSIKSASFPLDSIFKSVHSSRLTPLIKYTPGNRREPIYRIYSERVAPDGKKIAYLHEKKITKLARELGKAGQVSLYIQCKRSDMSLFLHFDRTGKIIVECEFADAKPEPDATSAISDELNPILAAVGKDTHGLKIPEFVSLRDVDVLRMKYIMKCEIENNIVFKNLPCLNSILLVESSDLNAGATLRYVRVDNYKEMNAQTMFINDNRDDVPTLMTGLMRNFGMAEEEAKMRIVAFFNEHADIRGKVLDNPGFLVDMRTPRMEESAVVITVDRITSLKYIELLHVYFDSILRLSQKPKTTAITKEHMQTVCKSRDKILLDTAAVVQNLPAKPVAMTGAFNLMEALGLKEDEGTQAEAEDYDDGVFFDDEEEPAEEKYPESPEIAKSEPLDSLDSLEQEIAKSESLDSPSQEIAKSESLDSPSQEIAKSESLDSLEPSQEIAKSESLDSLSQEIAKSESLEQQEIAKSESLDSLEPSHKSESLDSPSQEIAKSESLDSPSQEIAKSESLSFPEIDESSKVAKPESSDSLGFFPDISKSIPGASSPEKSGICLLFLTYGDIMHADKLTELGYFDESKFHVHIHPKFPDQVSNELQKHIIPTLVPTEWAKDSIIKATVELVKHALMQHPDSKWFVLLSQDVYPLIPGSEFETTLDTTPLSKFNLRAKTLGYVNVANKSKVEPIYKTSQWWVLNAEDAARLVQISGELSIDPKRISGSMDENFVLTAIGTADYEQKVVVYDEWLNSTTSLHPTLFNSLLSSDLAVMNKSGAAFLRKTTMGFTDSIYTPKPTLTIAVVGTETNQAELMSRIVSTDVVCIDMTNKGIPHEIITRSVKVYNCIWSDVDNAVREVYDKCKNVWPDSIKILNETGQQMPIPQPVQKCKLKYIHITKTGGTSVEEAAHTNNMCEWGKYDLDIRAATKNIWCKDFAFWHIPPRYFHASNLRKMMSKHDFFATVRNPFTRVVSEYYCKWGGPRTKSNKPNEINAWILDTLKQLHHDITRGVLITGHWVPQSYYFEDADGNEIIPASRRIKLESINADLPALLSQYAIEFELKKENESRNKSFGVADLSREVVQMILQIYEKDFSMLGYSTEIPQIKMQMQMQMQMQNGGADEDNDNEDNDNDNETQFEENVINEINEDKYKKDPTGMPLKNPNPFLKRLEARDPRLFLKNEDGKYSRYSTKCQPTQRQPVILTDVEKAKIDRDNPGSYKHAIKYGTDKDHQFWYICPRYWCFRTNTSITEEDVKAETCGKVITPEDIVRGTVPEDAHVYEFKNAKTHVDDKGKYIQHYPGFNMKDDLHPDGFCLPCCFKEWDSGRQGSKTRECLNPAAAKASRPAAAEIRQQLYIMDLYPLPNGRWGYLPNVARMFFGVDYKPLMDKHNASAIIPEQSVFLRYGVEQFNSQSFLGVFADMYAYIKNIPTPSVDEFREVLATAITLDVFVNIHNASLPQIFRDNNTNKTKSKSKGKVQLDKYKATEFYRRLSVAEDKDHRMFFEDAVVAYENFQRYLRDSTTTIDHTYLWDVFCAKLPDIHPDGVNLVMLEISDDDATEKIDLVCPTNAHSANSFDPKKNTVFVLKREEFYEPIYLYRTDGKSIFAQKTFTAASIHPNVKQILNMVGKVTGKYCAPLTSLPKVYKFKSPVSAHELVALIGEEAKTLVLNYRNKVVGVHNGKVVIPCYPSSLNGLTIPAKLMDELELFTDYETSRDELRRVNAISPRINCKPAFKVVDEGLVVGILTMTNQFVQLNPPSENVVNDGVETMENPNWNDEDLAVTKGPDQERVKMSKWIFLESQFYSTFQLIARELLNDPIRSDKRDRIIRAESMTMDYQTKVKEVERVLREVMASSVEFAEMDDEFLLHLDSVSQCNAGNETPYCVTQDDGTQKTLIPSKHLLSKLDNDVVYYGRLSDQLVRYSRVKAYVLYPEQSINARTTDYNLGDNEMLLVHSDITPEFFRRIDSRVGTPYVKTTAYDFAQPAMTQHYSRDTVAFADLANVGADQTLECVKPNLIPIVGNSLSMWVSSFPKTAREKVFLNSPNCTFHLMITIFQDMSKTAMDVAHIRTLLWNAYSPYMDQHAAKIVRVLKSQGKQTLMKSVENGSMTFETLVFSESYYLSDLDVWMMATRYNLPIVLFTATHLKGFRTNATMWLLAAAGPPGARFYFVRSGTTTVHDNVGEYHLVVPTMALNELGGFSEQFRLAKSGDAKFADCVVGLDQFLRSVN